MVRWADGRPRANVAQRGFRDPAVPPVLPTGTVTLLLADVEGSTHLWETAPDDMAAAIARMDRAVDDLVRNHAGVCPIEQGEGDSFVVAFQRVSDAVACAVGLQLAELSPIRLRIGLHTGEIRMRDRGKYMGPTVNRTARLRDLGHGGQILLSGTTAELAHDVLPEAAWLLDRGRHALRDLPRPERVAQLCHPGLRTEFPVLRTSSTAKPELVTRAVRQLQWLRAHTVGHHAAR
jgi:class 3 adenylate cyclase